MRRRMRSTGRHRPRGDGEIIARLTGLQNTNDWAKAGLMMRDQLTANAPYVFMMQTANYGAAFQYRTLTGGSAAPEGAN